MGLVLVTGGTGAVGPRIVALLRESGYRVRVLARHPDGGMFPADVDLYRGDVVDPSTVDRAMDGVSLVIHLAALLHIVDSDSGLDDEFERVNCSGTRHVVDAAVRHGVERLVYFSTITVYGSGTGSVFDEDSPVRPTTAYAKTKLAGEQIVLSAVRGDGRPLGTVLRLAAVYGSRVKGNYRRLMNALARGRFVPVGAGLNRRTIVYDHDVARAALLAATHPGAAGRVYNVSDGCPRQMREIVAAICNALGRKPPRFVLPIGPARLVAALAEDAATTVGLTSPLRRSTVAKYLEEVAVDGRRIRAELAFTPMYDITAGWAETVRELRSSGALPPATGCCRSITP